MRENHNTQSSEYIIICQDGLYIVSTTPEEIFYELQSKYEINIYLQDKYPHDPGGKNNYQIKEYLEHLYKKYEYSFFNKFRTELHTEFHNMNMLFNNKFETELHTEFHII